MESNYKTRTPVAYLTNKVRQNDRVGAVEVMQLEEVPALVLKEVWEDMVYETWIYAYEGILREAYIEADTPLNLGEGTGVMEVNSLDFEWGENGLMIEVEVEEGSRSCAFLKLRTEQGKGDQI